MTGLSLVILAARLARMSARMSLDWWLTIALIVVVGAGSYALAPAIAGYLSLGTLALLIMLPLRFDRAAQRAARAGEDDRALGLARIAAMLHPFGLVGGRQRALSALARIRAGAPLDEALLAELGATKDPVLAEWYRISALHAAGDAAAIRAALATPSRRVRMLQLGFGSAWVRAVGLTAGQAEVADAVVEAERYDGTLVEPDRRALLALEACAALGDAEGAHRVGAILGKRVPRGMTDWAIIAAHRASGDRSAARVETEQALARADLHPSARRAIELLRERPMALGAAPTRSPLIEDILARLHREAIAIEALAPLTGELRTRPTMTYAIGAAILLGFAASAATGDTSDPKHLADSGALLVPIAHLSEAWRLLSCTLLHAGPLHLVFNLFALVIFGRFVELFYGKLRMLAIYLVATLTSGIAVSILSDRQTVLVGASGAIFGLGGAIASALLFRSDLRRSRRGRDELRSFALIFGMQILFDNLIPAVSGTAHVAGLLGGAAIGALLVPRSTHPVVGAPAAS